MIPERLYETLPYLYVISGAQTALWLPHWTAALSGIGLVELVIGGKILGLVWGWKCYGHLAAVQKGF